MVPVADNVPVWVISDSGNTRRIVRMPNRRWAELYIEFFGGDIRTIDLPEPHFVWVGIDGRMKPVVPGQAYGMRLPGIVRRKEEESDE